MNLPKVKITFGKYIYLFFRLKEIQNIIPKNKLNKAKNQILLLGYLPPTPVDIKLPIPKKMKSIKDIVVIIDFIIFHLSDLWKKCRLVILEESY
jgi:hypothetical protein